MNVKTIAIFIVTSMMIMTMLASTVMAAITVDGLVSPANEWATEDLVATDPCTTEDHGMGLWGYNLKELYQHYNESSNTLYFRIDVCGTPADLDGDGDPNGPCDPPNPPADCTGVSPYESYKIGLTSSGYSGKLMVYANNIVSDGDANAQWGANCIEFSLANADTYVDPDNYCISVSAGGDNDPPYSEDLMYVCVYHEEPPTFSFTWSQKCDLNVRFSGHGTDDGNIVNHTWDFGDSSAPVTSNGPPGTTYHTFPANGTYTVTLSGYDNDGLSGTTSQTVHVAFVPCQDVPVQTPPGIAALIGLLGLIGAGVIMRRR